MLIDKRSILKEAQARAAARSIIAAEEKKRSAAALKNRHSVGAKRAEKLNDENRGEDTMAKKTEKDTEVKKTAAAAAPAAAKAESAEEKAPAKKTRTVKKADPKVNVTVEFAGKQIVAKEVKDAVIKAFKKANKGVEVKTVEIYMKPEENAAYYVVNGEGSEDYKVEL